MTLTQTIYGMLRFQLTGLSFLFILLPLLLLVYYLFPLRMRPAVLLAASVLLYQSGEFGNLRVLLLSVAGDYLLLRLMEYWDHYAWRRGLCLALSACKNFLWIIVYGAIAQANNLPQQIGLSVYTLSALSCLLAVYQRKIPYERNAIRFALYCSFFPKLFSGTMHPYGDYVEQLQSVSLSPAGMLTGAGRLVQGVFKAAIFGGSLYGLSQTAAALPPTALAAWLQVFASAFGVYYMLSGYCDMARGIGALFGLSLPRNFYYPYQSRSVSDFFDRFHMTVSGFLYEVVTFGFSRWKNRRAADIMCTLLTGLLLGLWFGMRLGYLLWGTYLALFILLERYAYPKLLESMPTLFCRIGTLCVVLAGFTVFSAGGLSDSGRLIVTMFSFGNALDEPVLYLLTSNWLLLLLSVFFATNIVDLVVVKLRRAAPAIAAAMFGAVDIVILLLYLALSL